MPTIDQLSSIDTLSDGDGLVVYIPSKGDARRAALSTLVEYLNGALTFPTDYETQYFAPSATGFTVTITPVNEDANVHLLMTPLAGYAAGTIVLPIYPGLADGQEVLVNSTQSVTTLTISLNGATAANGAPTTLAANAFFRLKFDAVLKSWYRVG